jgi:hypothetical protein
MSSFSAAHPAASSSSLISSRSFSSLTPSTREYNFELERLRVEYRRSEEYLQAERVARAAQEALYQQEIEEREARHQQELAEARRQRDFDPKGKRRGF